MLRAGGDSRDAEQSGCRTVGMPAKGGAERWIGRIGRVKSRVGG